MAQNEKTLVSEGHIWERNLPWKYLKSLEKFMELYFYQNVGTLI